MKKVYNYTILNEFLNIQATPQEIVKRLSEIAINYAATTNEMALEDMRNDLGFLRLMINCFESIIEKEN